MSDPRITPANDRVAHVSVASAYPDRRHVDGERQSIAAPVADLRRSPGGSLDRQAVMGEGVLSLEQRGGWSFCMLDRDGYVGWIATAEIGPAVDANHMVTARGSHLYPAPDVKRAPLAPLSFGARFRIVSETTGFMETDAGTFVPKPHLRSLSHPFGDPVTVAQIFFGTPYLWGGNSGTGIDCSGLVQAALLAAGIPCPGDSDLQEAVIGEALPASVSPRRGDLWFWKGHVAIVVDGEVLIHANAHHMAVAYEPITAAVARIEAQGGGPVITRRRLQSSLGLSS